MKKVLMTLVSFGISLAAGAEQAKDLSNYKTLDLNQFNGLNARPKADAIKFTVSCTTAEGKEIKSTDPGYQDCLSRKQRPNN